MCNGNSDRARLLTDCAVHRDDVLSCAGTPHRHWHGGFMATADSCAYFNDRYTELNGFDAPPRLCTIVTLFGCRAITEPILHVQYFD